jgi:hypothetical protein
MFAVGGCACTCGNCNMCFTCAECKNGVGTGSYVAGANVVVSQSGTSVASCTTNSSGQCCVSLPSGSYTSQITKSGYVTYNGSETLSCPTQLNVASPLGYILFTISGCTGPLPGATLTIGGSGYISDSNGQVRLTLVSGSYPWSVSATRFATATGTLVLSGNSCQSVTGSTSVTLLAAAGYTCTCACNLPISNTLHATDSVMGAYSLSYDSTLSGSNGFPTWSGTVTFTLGFCGCAQHSQTIPATWEVPSPGGTCSQGRTTYGFCAMNPGSLNFCPVASPCTPNTSEQLSSGASLTCPPSFSFSASQVIQACGVQGISQLLGPSQTQTVTISE